MRIVVHPGTDTYFLADECFVLDVADDFVDWDEHTISMYATMYGERP
jgi:hypothetical protein